MARPIGVDETIAHAVRRIVRADLGDAQGQLEQSQRGSAEAVHAVRTAIKKARAMARMVRPRVRRKAARAAQADQRLRAIAHRIGDLREAHVLLGTLDDLAQDWPGKKPDSLRKLRAYFSVRLDEATRTFDQNDGFAKLARRLRRARRRVKRWTKLGDGWKSFGPGVARQYRQAHDRMAQAYQAATGAGFHAWRRSVKSHRHQLHALLDLWPTELRGRVDKLDRLGDLLGEEHDLTVLESILRGTPTEVLDRSSRDELVRQLNRRREHRRAQAQSLGAPLFREAPDVFERRLKTAFREHRR